MRRPLQKTAPAETPIDEPTEDEVHIEFITRLRCRCLTDGQIIKACRKQFGFGASRTRRLLALVGDHFRGRVEARRQSARAEQIERVRDEIQELREPRYRTTHQRVSEMVRGRVVWRSIEVREQLPVPPQLSRLEDLLADLEGNRAPLKVDVNVQHKQALMAVFVQLDDDRLTALYQRALQRKLLAEQREPAILTVGNPGSQ